MQRANVYVLDDNETFRASLQWMLEGAGYTVSTSGNPLQTVERLARIDVTQPACLMLDICMPAMSGMDLHDILHLKGIDLPILYMSGHADVPIAVAAMGKGATTLLQKPLCNERLKAALDHALSPRVQCLRQSAEDRLQMAERLASLDTLSQRESQVLSGISEGRSAREISEYLFISPKTVEYHRSNLLRKLGVRNVAQLQRVVASAGQAA